MRSRNSKNMNSISGYFYLSILFLTTKVATSVKIINKPGNISSSIFLPLCLEEKITLNSLMMLELINYEMNVANTALEGLKNKKLIYGYDVYDTCYEDHDLIEAVLDVLLVQMMLSRMKNVCVLKLKKGKNL